MKPLRFAVLVVLISSAMFSLACGGGTGGGIITPPPGTIPTITFTTASATVELGKSAEFPFTVTGSPKLTVTCSLSGPGSASVGTNSVTLSIPAPLPAAWSSGGECTAKNSAGSAKASFTATLEYPVPILSSVSRPVIYCPTEYTCLVVSVNFAGSGFYPGGKLTISKGVDYPVDEVVLADSTEPTQILGSMSFDYPRYYPGWFEFTVTSPSDGHGGGTSNKLYSAVTTLTNGLTLTDKYVVTDGGVFWPDGSRNNNFGTGSGRGTTSLSFDETTEYLSSSGAMSPYISFAGDHWAGELWLLGTATDVDSHEPFMDSDTHGGYACVSEWRVGSLGLFDVVNNVPNDGEAPLTMVVNLGEHLVSLTEPVAIADLPGGGLACAAYDIGDRVFSVLDVRTGTLLWSTILTDITASPLGGELNAQTLGGWQMKAFRSGANSSKVALLADYDKKLKFIDLATKDERTIDLSGVGGYPVRVATDDVNGAAVVAFVRPDTGTSVFVRVSLDGTITPLQPTSRLLPTGLAVSGDGAKIYVGNRKSLDVLPNN